MPGSFRHFDALIADRIGLDFPDRANTRILDIGAGAGKYRDLLYDYKNMCAVEAHQPYIDRFKLRDRYNVVSSLDVRLWAFAPSDLVILGDVIEHMSVEDAQKVLARCDGATLVAVPYNYVQDDVGGVEWERHLQPDLTHEVFMERYPGFTCIARDDTYGVYVRGSEWTLDEAVDPAKAYVMIASRTMDWRNYIHLTMSLWKLQQFHYQYNLAPLALQFQNGARADTSINLIIAKLLNWPADDPYGKPTHLLSVDSDQGFDPGTLIRLLYHRAHFVGVPIRKKTQTIEWNVSAIPETGGETYWNGHLLNVGPMGLGFTLISRVALERMAAEYEHLNVTDETGLTVCRLSQTTDISEDMELCRKWTTIGGHIWADPTQEVCHIGPAEFSGKLIDHMELDSRFPQQPALEE